MNAFTEGDAGYDQRLLSFTLLMVYSWHFY